MKIKLWRSVSTWTLMFQQVEIINYTLVCYLFRKNRLERKENKPRTTIHNNLANRNGWQCDKKSDEYKNKWTIIICLSTVDTNNIFLKLCASQ